jgi:short-subunit dehydrogenase
MSDKNREIAGATVFLTGASGGIGQAIISAMLAADAAEIIAVSRTSPMDSQPRVRPITLDVRDADAVNAAAAEFAPRVDILINNAGINGNLSVFRASDTQAARDEMDVNYFGILNTARAFGFEMRERRRGVIINMLSSSSLVNIPRMGTYSAAKAAAASITQAIRAELSPYGVHVCGMFPGVTDTKMSAQLTVPKLAPTTVAAALIEAIRNGVEDQYDGIFHRELYDALRADPKAVERRMAATVAPVP